MLDLDDLAKSDVTVLLDVSRAKAGFVFATEALKSREVLDATRHPTIRFQSTQISGGLRRASVNGSLTVRGVTRPVTLCAELYRQRGTQESERSKLTVLLTGAVDRNALGASGFPGEFGPIIELRILVRVNR